MKKFLKPLIVATSVAAVVGIGAVSFAAWKATNHQTQTGSTGSVELIAVGTPTTVFMTGLLPYDQNGTTSLQTTTDKTLGAFTVAITLDNVTSYDLNVVAETDATNSKGITFGTDTKLYATLAEPTAAITAASLSSWKEVSVTGGQTFTGQSENSVVVYVVLDSNNKADMTKDFKITVTATKAA